MHGQRGPTDLLEEVKRATQLNGWPLSVQRTVALAAGSGRVRNVVPRVHAMAIYVRMHRVPVALVADVQAVVRQNPSRPLRDDKLISLRDFARYKAFLVQRTTSGRLPEKWADSLSAWCSGIHCDGHGDPRCLPLQTFDASRLDHDLNESAGRQAFTRQYGPPRQRVDDSHRSWRLADPGARHGRDPVTVAGRRLAEGIHWDVTGRGATTLCTLDQVWRIQPRGYVNVYPDGALRGGNRAVRQWSASESAEADKSDRGKGQHRSSLEGSELH